MICSLSIKYLRPAAWLMYLTFCFQIVMPLNGYTSGQAPLPIPKENHNHNIQWPAVKNNSLSSNMPDFPSQIAAAPMLSSGMISEERKMKVAGPGPGQPEMQSFQSVNTTNMVDLFTGDFSYNIPLLDVGGYPVNIHYTGGISMDQDASWVGLGWNINPGTISRSMRGIPDDFNGEDSIARTQHVKPNKTAGVTVGGDFELVGLPMNVGASIGVFQNNYNGWGIETGINASINSGAKSSGSLSGTLSISNNSQTGLDISPGISVNLGDQEQRIHGRSTLSTNFNSRTGIEALRLNTQVRAATDFTKKMSNALHVDVTGFPISSSISFATPAYIPTISMPYTSMQYAFTGKVGLEKWTAHPSVFISGYVSEQEIKPEDSHQSLPAYGYLYYSSANNSADALFDVNREKETQFNAKTSPMIAIPQYTYDLYSISGEGTGGMFRPYRGEIGYVGDHSIRTKSSSFNFSVDVGFGAIVHAGADVIPVIASTRTGVWTTNNPGAINNYIQFQKKDSIFQDVYFRNPGEKTSNTEEYFRSVGDDTLMRVKLGGSNDQISALNAFTLMENTKQIGELVVNKAPAKTQRDKTTQVINYLTAREAGLYGLDKQIKSVAENTIPLGDCSDSFTVVPRVDNVVRKKHHLSEIDVINTDGRRYVYGLPVYNIMQKEVTFSVKPETDPENINKGLVNYTPGQDNSTLNSNGKEGYFTQDSMPGFAHDFLLTGILSPDYVDITGDGITEDDIGDAVKFNYTEIYGQANNYFDWRAPYEKNKANYNEGLKTYNRDDKGTYLYGKKEVWYLNSIESKTMIAVFKIENDRQDSKAVEGENGGYDNTKKLRRLDRIDLYAKADLIANNSNARPVKTVNFAYSYRLCSGIDPDNSNISKLTLDSIWFSYNGNNKGRQNPYVFRYSPDENGQSDPDYNPSYNSKNYDRWGNFKDPISNPSDLDNADFPYTVQDSTTAAKYATAWQLTDIQLPSSGRLKITYESDDYAYVQNKRAMQLFEIAGFGATPTATPTDYLYSTPDKDNDYLFINSSIPIYDLQDLRAKYFGNGDTLYFKIAVKMPTDIWGSGYEFIPGYGVIEEIGIINGAPNQFWIKLKRVGGESPVSRAAFQFLRLNLPSKAYPGSEVGNNLNFADMVKMLASGIWEIQNTIGGFNKSARRRGFCQMADLTKSFVRLTSPEFKKYGGGSRVKRIELFDNWNKMTGQHEASYGQEYNYTTTEEVNGQNIVISSGVASYEPAIGNDENPFRQPVPYVEKLAPLAPVNYLFIEEPVGESFFPSAYVGYSKVTIRTIHREAQSADGWEETTFYTTKDFPTRVDYTVLDDHSKKRYNPKLSALLKIKAKNYLTLSQGFRVQLNDMNGKMKSQASYPETDSLHPIRATYYYYKEMDNGTSRQRRLDNRVSLADSHDGHIYPNGIIGKDIEVMVDLREQSSQTVSMQISPNVDVIPFFWFPLPIPSNWHLPQLEETRFRSAATVKVIQRYGILDSVVVVDKGSIVATKNLVYDAETGEVVVSRTYNEFEDPVYQLNYPAYWAYSGMGPAYQNTGAEFYKKDLVCINGRLLNRSDKSDFPVSHYFESGDELWVTSTGESLTDTECDVPTFDTSTKAKKLWIMDASKAIDHNEGLYFIDAAGVPYTGVIDSLKVIRSGKRNMMQASAGSLVSLSDPVRETSPGNFKIIIDSSSQVIATSAATYKDLWKVENSFYQKDTTVRVIQDMPTAYIPVTVTNFKKRYDAAKNQSTVATYNTNSTFLATSYQYLRKRNVFGCKSVTLATKSALTFDLSVLGEGAMITSASLNLGPKVPKGYWSLSYSNCRDKSYDWNTATTFYREITSQATLKRITQAWNLNNWNEETSYDLFFTTPSHVVTTGTNSISQPQDLTNIIKDIAAGANYGLMFESTTSTHNGNNATLDYLSFCATDQYNVNSPNCSVATLARTGIQASPAAAPNTGIPCNCSGLFLAVNYRQYVDSTYQVCRLNISDSATNPYRWGMLGNWRIDRDYTYYSTRNESDAADTVTNIRREGVLKNFSSFWQITDKGLVANPDTIKWVWNTAASLYNRKGFEIENYDALGRYNSGLYGYNESLPVAVSQNTRYSQELFDGFEDYNYQAQHCTTCASPREFDFVKDNAMVSVSNDQSHTGLYSLKVNAGSQASLSVPVSAPQVGGLSFEIDSTAIFDTQVVGNGTGLTGSYYGYIPGSPSCGADYTTKRLDTMIYFSWGSTPPFGHLCETRYTVTWKGFIQAPLTGTYSLLGSSDYMVSIKVGNDSHSSDSGNNIVGPLPFSAGELYPVTIRYTYYNSSNSYIQLIWIGPEIGFQLIPKSYLYPEDMTAADTVGSIIRNIRKWCIDVKNVKPQNMINPVFSPMQHDHLIVSGWARIDDANCNTMPAPDNVIKVSFDQQQPESSVYLNRTGARIEGWQRYEAEVVVPEGATMMHISAAAPPGYGIFFDDIKTEPFNGSSKAFIYNPVNLRLMSELDENNYATFYEYDDDGTLIRVKREMERGIMTIQETRSALTKEE